MRGLQHSVRRAPLHMAPQGARRACSLARCLSSTWLMVRWLSSGARGSMLFSVSSLRYALLSVNPASTAGCRHCHVSWAEPQCRAMLVNGCSADQNDDGPPHKQLTHHHPVDRHVCTAPVAMAGKIFSSTSSVLKWRANESMPSSRLRRMARSLEPNSCAMAGTTLAAAHGHGRLSSRFLPTRSIHM